MIDVLVVGAGPAGSVAATVLARSGARVLVLDRSPFPRDKLCGDTLNPGALADLERLAMAGGVHEAGLGLRGMVLTGENGVRVEAPYPRHRQGRALPRRLLDEMLLRRAIAAGAEFEDRVTALEPLRASASGEASVAGAVVRRAGGRRVGVRATVTIAADGRRSMLARHVGLRRRARGPRRWAIGAHLVDVAGLGAFGEMHVRRDRYIGVAPLPDGLANVCLVSAEARGFGDPATALREALERDGVLAERVAGARLIGRPSVLGPLAEERRAAGVPGLLLAGDACGFIDPMTGDGLRFAVRGGELAADVATWMLASGSALGHRRLERLRRREFGRKWRFDLGLRWLVASPGRVRVSSLAATMAPAVFRRVVAIAGDAY